MTDLARRLIARIDLTGPLSIADYMTECLLHPTLGYYATRDPLGAAGDFTTAPEISQMFGECLGLALAQAWMDRGAPAPFSLVELGPGRGTLMADIVRATTRVPGFLAGAEVHLVEASPALREVQARTLAGGPRPIWHDSAATLPDLPMFLLANEFFDVLPVRQFLRAGAGWRERVVGLRDGALAFGLTDPTPVAALTARLDDTVEGDLVELCTAAAALAEDIGRRIAHSGGVAIVVDYGGAASRGDTFQAVRAHAKVDPLDTPGQADLTAHVDFTALARAAGPGITARRVPQGVLLERLGITARAEVLARGLAGPALDAHVRAHRRLTHPEEMGSLFQALALFAEGTPAPPGFET